MIREHARGYRVKDEISEVLGDVRYMENWYPKGLKEATVGPHSLDIVGVSRYYFLRTPKIVVDFEPSPLDRKFWLDEKRKFFYDEGLVYVPIMLREQLTAEQFRERVKLETEYLLTGRRYTPPIERALAKVSIDDVLQHLPVDRTVEDAIRHPATKQWIDEETMRRFQEKHGHKSQLRGVARMSVIERIKRAVIEDARERIKHGRLGRLSRDQQSPVPAGR